MRSGAKASVVTGLLAISGLSGGCSLYFARGSSGGSVLWDTKEAYLFVGVSLEGHHVSRVRYPWFTAKEYFGAVEEPDDGNSSLIVMRVTASGVERHTLMLPDKPDSSPTDYIPLDGRVYAKCPALGICKWAGDHFEPATEEERRRLGGTTNSSAAGTPRFQNGWAKREFGTGPRAAKFVINVGDKFKLSIDNTAVPGTGYGAISIDLLRPGQPPQSLWALDGRPRKVSSSEYQTAFPQRK